MTEPVLALRATTSDPLGTAQPGPSVPRDVLAEDPLRAIARILSIARANLPMDVAFVTRLEGDRQTFAYLDGDCESFGWQQGTEIPAKDGYCHHVLAGDLPGVVSDAARHPVAAALPATAQAGIGAYIGVPLVLPNGRVYGALCCTSHDAREDLGPSEHAFVRVLAELVAEQLGRLSEQEARRAATVDTLAPYLEPGGITMAAQPIVRLADGHVVGVEALARFPGHAGSPADIFAAAARAGLGVALEVAALTAAVALLEHLPAHVYLSVNASPDAVLDPRLRGALAGVPRGRVVVELTEHVEVTDYAALVARVAELRRDGILLAVDDAGSGYASLQHVLALSPDIIKLDLALVRGVSVDPARRALIRALTHFAEDCGAVLVAEGIETVPELEALRGVGVGHGQGYHLGRPAPVETLDLSSARYVGPERRTSRPWSRRSAPRRRHTPGRAEAPRAARSRSRGQAVCAAPLRRVARRRRRNAHAPARPAIPTRPPPSRRNSLAPGPPGTSRGRDEAATIHRGSSSMDRTEASRSDSISLSSSRTSDNRSTISSEHSGRPSRVASAGAPSTPSGSGKTSSASGRPKDGSLT